MKVQATKKFESIIDATIGRKRPAGEVFEVNEQRAQLLLSRGLVIAVDEPKEEPKAEPAIEKPKTEKPAKPRKSRKKR